LRNAVEAAIKANIKGTRVHDCFCGTGTLLVAAIKAGANYAIGSDIEDYSVCIRKELQELKNVELHWGIDAFDAIKKFDYDVLFIDPPSPNSVLGGTRISVVRDIGLHGHQIRKFWKERFSPRNWIGKGSICIGNVFRVISFGLESDKRVIANLFANRNGFSYYKTLKPFFRMKHLYANWYEILKR